MKLIFALLFMAALAADAPKKPQTQPTTRPVSRKDVGPDEFEKLWQDKKGIVLDVRTTKEYDAGHIPGAVNIDINSPTFDKQISDLDKSQTYLVHCASGIRSVRACEKMTRQDFKNLINLEGGLKAWQKAGKPVEK
jgi:phage shock protein E